MAKRPVAKQPGDLKQGRGNGLQEGKRVMKQQINYTEECRKRQDCGKFSDFIAVENHTWNHLDFAHSCTHLFVADNTGVHILWISDLIYL